MQGGISRSAWRCQRACNGIATFPERWLREISLSRACAKPSTRGEITLFRSCKGASACRRTVKPFSSTLLSGFISITRNTRSLLWDLRVTISPILITSSPLRTKAESAYYTLCFESTQCWYLQAQQILVQVLFIHRANIHLIQYYFEYCDLYFTNLSFFQVTHAKHRRWGEPTGTSWIMINYIF